MRHHPVVSRAEWFEAQQNHLKTEKALTRMRDLVAAERRALPWMKVEKTYVFDTAEGEKTLADLFGGNTQLVVHHLMFHPDWNAACVGCSFQADHIDGPLQHLRHRDVSIVAVSRAPIDKIEAYRKRMGWSFDWVSSGESDFNYDFHVSVRPEEVATGSFDYNFGTITLDPREQGEEFPGVSVFCREADGGIFLTQSIYARGLDLLIGAHHYLDVTPKGRGNGEITVGVKRHDEYEDDPQPSAAAGA